MQIRRRLRALPLMTSLDSRYAMAAHDAQPSNILEEIVWHKEQEVLQRSQQISLFALQQQIANMSPPADFQAALQRHPLRPSLIAEVKKASPSKGVIRADFDPVAIAQAYETGGAACLSVLTDEAFFQGSLTNLRRVKQQVSLPVLCKEFIIDPYQIYLARSAGADAVLLITAVLADADLQALLAVTQSLHMQALIEVHTLAELDRVLTLEGIQLVGINNRNLEDFTVNLDTTRKLLAARRSQLHQRHITVVSESGLHTSADLAFAAESGARAVLVGEALVKQPDIGRAVERLLEGERSLSIAQGGDRL